LSECAHIGIVSCTPDAPLAKVAELMASNRVHAVVVVDDERAEPPVISDLDLAGAVASDHFDHLRASDVAGTEAISLKESDSLAHAAQVFADRKVSHVIVRNDRRYPIGIVSTHDLAVAIAGSA
jgi:CBS domain-containing protein